MTVSRYEAVGLRDLSVGPASPAYLLARLAGEYPELPIEALQCAFDQAAAAAAALGGGHRLTAALARDRLNVVRERRDAAARRTGRPVVVQDPPDPVGARPEPDMAAVPCTYCRAPVPLSSFTYWSTTARLLAAACPNCQRQMSVLASTWRRWTTHKPIP